jgi:hypothetical protein
MSLAAVDGGRVAVAKGEGVVILQASEPIIRMHSTAMFTFMFIIVVLFDSVGQDFDLQTP